MRRRDCEFNLDISMRQQTPSDDNKMRILERRAAVAYCGHTVRHCTRACRCEAACANNLLPVFLSGKSNWSGCS